MSGKKRYAHVGLGSRSGMFTNAVIDTFSDHCEYVGLCDSNQGRLNLRQKQVKEKGIDVPVYDASEFDTMIEQTKPDAVIVTTKDCYHDQYIVRAMELGCDAITEKPMTTDEEKCQKIIDTQKQTGKHVRVTFNYRYSPPRTQLKDMLMNGIIGDILSVDFHWLLNIRHGADYFRRWHRNKENSGGLMVHKATHHFDLINWWLSAVPEKVYAAGHRRFYTPKTADRYGLDKRSDRCHTCPEKEKCKFFLDLEGSENLKALYLDNEDHDGYFRDRCVFSEDIDIEDSMNVVVQYDSGAIMTYSLNAFLPWEGYHVQFNGTKGRLEHMCQESVYVSGDGTVPGELKKEGTWFKIFPHFSEAYQVQEIWTGTGGHGGGDNPLLTDVFHPDPPEDKYVRAADQRSGALSILTGVAANRSMEREQPVMISDLVSGLERPEYTQMPDPEEALPM